MMKVKTYREKISLLTSYLETLVKVLREAAHAVGEHYNLWFQMSPSYPSQLMKRRLNNSHLTLMLRPSIWEQLKHLPKLQESNRQLRSLLLRETSWSTTIQFKVLHHIFKIYLICKEHKAIKMKVYSSISPPHTS